MNFQEFKNLLISNRTIRRFQEDKPVTTETLEHLVDLTRYCASGRNAQPLRYVIVNDEETKDKIFDMLKWAGYYTDWNGPESGERPAAYLIQCLDTTYGKDCLCDDGLQLEAITLGMHTLGLGGCIIKAFNAPGVTQILNLNEKYVPRYVLALGYPAETVRLEDMASEDSDFKYYRTSDGIHHVPKRTLSQIILKK